MAGESPKPLDDPRLTELFARIRAGVTDADMEQFFYIAMENGQALYAAAHLAAGGHFPLIAAILESAWARAAADAELLVTPADRAGVLQSLETRLDASARAIRDYYYPRWTELLNEQDQARQRKM